MPNWCSNRVTVSGDNIKEVEQVKKFFESENPFNEIKPAPKWSEIPLAEDETESLGRTRGEVGELPKLKIHKSPDGSEIFRSWEFPSTGVQDDRWYDWQIQNWGTKWDIHRDHVEWGDEDENYFVCHFDTAWSPPEEIYYALREQFPDLSFSWFYDEPGMEFAGYL